MDSEVWRKAYEIEFVRRPTLTDMPRLPR